MAEETPEVLPEEEGAGPDPELAAEEPHLGDLSSVAEVAQWLLAAVGTGVVGNTAFQVLLAVRNRFGQDRVGEVEARVLKLVKEQRGKSKHLSNKDLELRVKEIFDRLR